MDPKIVKKTQDTLGKVIKKPPLTDKLLGKPPFRFLHDIMTSVIKTTGFMQGLYTDAEMNSENVKEKDAKLAFLQKAIDMVSAVTGNNLSVRPVKIVAGHEPEKTNEFLQCLAEAINKGVDNDEYVKRVTGGGGSAKGEKKEERRDREKDRDKEKDRTKSADRRKGRDSEEKDRGEKDRDREKSRDKGDRERKHDREKDKDRHKDRDRESKREKSRDGRDREDRHKERSRKDYKKSPRGSPTKKAADLSISSTKLNAKADVLEAPSGLSGAERPHVIPMKDDVGLLGIAAGGEDLSEKVGGGGRESSLAEGNGHGSGRHKQSVLPVDEKMKTGDHRSFGTPDGDHSQEKENESPAREKMNGEKEKHEAAPARLQRPSSAKGSRRRREAQNHAALEDEEFQKPMAPSNDAVVGEGDLPPQVAAARQLARPSSARPAPPRPKQDAMESEPAMRLGAGQPANLIVDDDDEDEDENFLVEESAPPPPEIDHTPTKPAEEEDAEHGALVKKMLESKKEIEGANQTKKTEIERPTMSDAQRRKQRELVQKEVDKLRGSIQSLTRSANPLGKVMDYVQEDLDSMQQELDKWKAENAQHALDLKREMNVTDRAIEPLKQQLTELERAIGDQLDQIAATKSNIIKNDQKIQKMLRGISSS